MAQHASLLDEVFHGMTFEYDSNACVVHRGKLIQLFAKESPSGTSIDLFADIDDHHRRVLLEAPSSSFIPSSANIGAEERSREQIDHVVATLAFQLLQQRMEIDSLKRENHLLKHNEQMSEEGQVAQELARSGEEAAILLANHENYIRLRSSLPGIDPFTDAVLDEPLFVAQTCSPLQASDSSLAGSNLRLSTSANIESIITLLEGSSISSDVAELASPISSASLDLASPSSSQLPDVFETSASIQDVSSTESGNSSLQSQEPIVFVEASADLISTDNPSLLVESSSSKEMDDGIMSKEEFEKWWGGPAENAPTEELREAAIDACTRGYLPLLQYMQSKLGLDWKAEWKTVEAMVSAAASCGSLSILRYLRSQSVELKRKYDAVYYPVDPAIANGQLEVLRWLKEEIGLDLLLESSKSPHPLQSACYGGYLSVLKYLVAVGGNLKWKSERSFRGSNLAHAAASGAWTCCHLKDERKARKQASEEKEGSKADEKLVPSWRDVKLPKRTSNAFEVLQWLHEKGVDIHAKQENGVTTAHLAARAGHLPMLRWLYSKGVDLLVRSRDGASIAHFAAKGLHVKVLEWLVDTLKLDLNGIRTLDGSTIAHYAGLSRYDIDGDQFLETVKYLHSKGVDLKVKRRTASAQTLLSLAPLHLPTLQWLHSVGVNVKTACVQASSRKLDDNGQFTTILLDALDKEQLEMLKWLHSLGVLTTSVMGTKVGTLSPIDRAAYYGHLEILKWLHSIGYDVIGLNRKPQPQNRNFLLSAFARTPIYDSPPPYLAAAKLQLAILDWYIDEAGMDIHAIDPKTGASFLSIAAFHGNTKLLTWLSGRNVKISSVPRIDFSLPVAKRKPEFVHIAVVAASQGHRTLLEYLHASGDNFLEDGVIRDQLLDIAASLHYFKVLKWVAGKGYDISRVATFDTEPLTPASDSGEDDSLDET